MAQRKKLVIVFFVVCFLMLVLSCGGLLRCCLFEKEPTTPAGTYVGAYGPAGVEIVYLFPDGRLEQTLLRGTTIVYRNQGSWRLVKAPYHNFEIQNFMVARPAPWDPPSPTAEPRFLDRLSIGLYASTWYAPTEIIAVTISEETYLRKVSSRLPPPDPSVPRMRDFYRGGGEQVPTPRELGSP